ncbi:MAG: type VI secretion system protein [Flavobacteriales bacterium]|jgi:type VI secretion system protein
MDLVFKVTGDTSDSGMLEYTKTFTTAGGTFGRADSNEWVLPDKDRHISSIHGRILFDGESYVLVDESTNGIFLNGSSSPLGTGNQIVLQDGYKLGFCCYILSVTLKSKPAPIDLPEGLAPVDFLDSSDKDSATTFSQSSVEARQFDSLLEPSTQNTTANIDDWGSNPTFSGSADELMVDKPVETDPLSAIDNANQEFPSDPWGTESAEADDEWWKDGSDSDNALAPSQAMPVQAIRTPQPAGFARAEYSHPPNAPANQTTPTNQRSPQPITSFPDQEYVEPAVENVEARSPQAISPQPIIAPLEQAYRPQPPLEAPRAATYVDATLASLLGLPEKDNTELSTEVAGIVVESVSRLIDLLRTRTTIKNELRAEHTMIKSVNNNPLKFSVSSDEALKVMFRGDNGAFLDPVGAVKEGFDDISDHQIAVLAGMRAAYASMLNQFSPQNLERRFKAGAQNASVFKSKKALSWDSYQDYFRGLHNDDESAYQQLFGETFASVYSEQLAELKASRNLN